MLQRTEMPPLAIALGLVLLLGSGLDRLLAGSERSSYPVVGLDVRAEQGVRLLVTVSARQFVLGVIDREAALAHEFIHGLMRDARLFEYLHRVHGPRAVPALVDRLVAGDRPWPALEAVSGRGGLRHRAAPLPRTPGAARRQPAAAGGLRAAADRCGFLVGLGHLDPRRYGR